ncbi:hypothetical protein Srufu_031740 [Streptomyces libani subsp. rufus]|nr:hypothetical protein Srufu_031740 [Streptomyces libani subsp. rufus]
MSAEITAPGPGANVKVLRLERGWLQDQLAGRARMSTSMLGKIERGERPLTQGMGAVLAGAFGITLDELLGQVPVRAGDQDRLTELRAAMRCFDLPAGEPVRGSASHTTSPSSSGCAARPTSRPSPTDSRIYCVAYRAGRTPPDCPRTGRRSPRCTARSTGWRPATAG